MKLAISSWRMKEGGGGGEGGREGERGEGEGGRGRRERRKCDPVERLQMSSYRDTMLCMYSSIT